MGFCGNGHFYVWSTVSLYFYKNWYTVFILCLSKFELSVLRPHFVKAVAVYISVKILSIYTEM